MGTLLLVSALGAGLVAGVLFAFSSFVMPGLAAAPPAAGMSAMQTINVAAVTPPFMLVFFGTALCCVAVSALSFRGPFDRAVVLRLAGVAAYLSAIVITIVYHVPRNDALATFNSSTSRGMAYWSLYLAQWIAWNHVRAGAAFIGAFLLTLAYRAA